ncbi:MAG: hypothetical protein JKY01_06115 [Pseudomonadales bacterium]|nr:hypothetical protein [Pseudomonadales bacterium]
MSFQEYCQKAKEIDQQIVSTKNSFVISFSKLDGGAFTIDPADIVLFLKFLSDNHHRCIEAIETAPLFSKSKTYLSYQEKSYRALYKLAGESGLKAISSLGGSQTKELTKVISKLIAYLANLTYQKVVDNSYYDKKSVDIALSKMPADLKELGVIPAQEKMNNKDRFIKWLKDLELSDRTISSYSETSIPKADQILVEHSIFSEGLYTVSSIDEANKLAEWLNNNDDWKQKNSSGNGMYQAGLKKYLQFLSERPQITTLPKPFVLLAGISGTGKTRFVREQALAHAVDNKNFCQIPVRPDWHEPSDLLGYVSRISDTKYIATKALQFIIDAWRVIAPKAGARGVGELDLSVPPYWLCLDEMNLAPVEQYFADYLSVLESRKFEGDEYTCEPLLDKSILTIDDADIRADLGLQDDDGLWAYFLNYGIPLPPNLIVAGTVNMDETTHGFSRKVIDRALTIDFGEFFPNDYSKFFAEQNIPKLFSYSTVTQASKSDLAASIDPTGQKTIDFLESINKILKQTPFELAYRALNELLLHVACFKPQDENTLQAVWDDFLMTKILPRIDGDEDKLRIVGNAGAENLLDALSKTLESQLSGIWSVDRPRKDLFSETHDGGEINDIPCRSRNKLEWMKSRLEANTFTSFWP